MTTATARSSRFPRSRNSLNSFIMVALLVFGRDRRTPSLAPAPAPGRPSQATLGATLGQPGVDRGLPPSGGRDRQTAAAARSSQSITARLSASAGTSATRPRRGWSWVTRHPSGTGRPRSRSCQATLRPRGVLQADGGGLGAPGRRRCLPGIQVTVGTLWVDPPRKANGPGGGRLVLLVDDRLRVDPPGPAGLRPSAIWASSSASSWATNSNSIGPGPAHVWRSSDAVGQGLELGPPRVGRCQRPDHELGEPDLEEAPRAWRRSPSMPDRHHRRRVDAPAGRRPGPASASGSSGPGA